MLRRNIEEELVAALADTPAVFLSGPRQAGKSTLARALAERPSRTMRYLTLDDAATFSAAATDPQGFVESLSGPTVLDEVQRVPELFRALKLSIDRDRRPGRFLLTGSADPLLAPRLSESLAGRIAWRTLWPFSQGEIAGMREAFVDRLFEAGRPPDAGGEPSPRRDLVRRALTGGFPEAVARRDAGRRRDWLGSYLTAILQRDVRELAQVEGLALFPRLLALAAARGGGALNVSALGRDAGIPFATLRRYLVLLEALHILRTIPAWSTNAVSRLVKAPKLLVTDSGLLAHLAGWDETRIEADPTLAGPLLEAFAGTELLKQLGWSRTRAELHWFRTATGREVDFVLEAADGRVVGIEVKATTSINNAHFSGLRELAELAGERFHHGALLYAGREALPFGKKLTALPLSALWRLTETPRPPRKKGSATRHPKF